MKTSAILRGYSVTLVANCIHCAAELGRSEPIEYGLLTHSVTWFTPRSCECELAAAAPVPHARVTALVAPVIEENAE